MAQTNKKRGKKARGKGAKKAASKTKPKRTAQKISRISKKKTGRKSPKKAIKNVRLSLERYSAIEDAVGCCTINYPTGGSKRYPGRTERRCEQIARDKNATYSWVAGECLQV